MTKPWPYIFLSYYLYSTLNIASFLLIMGRVNGPLYVALIAALLIKILSLDNSASKIFLCLIKFLSDALPEYLITA